MPRRSQAQQESRTRRASALRHGHLGNLPGPTRQDERRLTSSYPDILTCEDHGETRASALPATYPVTLSRVKLVRAGVLTTEISGLGSVLLRGVLQCRQERTDAHPFAGTVFSAGYRRRGAPRFQPGEYPR